MQQINSFGLFRLKNNEHFQFMTDVNDCLSDYQLESVSIQNLLVQFQQLLELEAQYLRRQRGSLLSQQLSAFDRLRDRTWVALQVVVDGIYRGPFQEEVASARVLKQVLDRYKELPRQSYVGESGGLRLVIEKLKEEAYAHALARLGLAHWLVELERQNEVFDRLLAERNTVETSKVKGTVRDVRRQVDPVYKQLVDRINAAIVLELVPSDTDELAKRINQLITRYRSILRGRQSAKAEAAEMS